MACSRFARCAGRILLLRGRARRSGHWHCQRGARRIGGDCPWDLPKPQQLRQHFRPRQPHFIGSLRIERIRALDQVVQVGAAVELGVPFCQDPVLWHGGKMLLFGT